MSTPVRLDRACESREIVVLSECTDVEVGQAIFKVIASMRDAARRDYEAPTKVGQPPPTEDELREWRARIQVCNEILEIPLKAKEIRKRTPS